MDLIFLRSHIGASVNRTASTQMPLCVPYWYLDQNHRTGMSGERHHQAAQKGKEVKKRVKRTQTHRASLRTLPREVGAGGLHRFVVSFEGWTCLMSASYRPSEQLVVPGCNC